MKRVIGGASRIVQDVNQTTDIINQLFRLIEIIINKAGDDHLNEDQDPEIDAKNQDSDRFLFAAFTSGGEKKRTEDSDNKDSDCGRECGHLVLSAWRVLIKRRADFKNLSNC